MSKELWWLKDKKFSRVRYSTLCRLALLFQSEVYKGKYKDSSGAFVLWLDRYIEDNL